MLTLLLGLALLAPALRADAADQVVRGSSLHVGRPGSFVAVARD